MLQSGRRRLSITTGACIIAYPTAAASGQTGAAFNETYSRGVVTVSSRTMSWGTRIYRKLGVGLYYGLAPKLVFDAARRPGARMRTSVVGSTTIAVGGGPSPATGLPDVMTAARPEAGWPRLAMRYFARGERPAQLDARVEAFVDADGHDGGTPFLIGGKAGRSIPDGAAALSFSFADGDYSGNAS